VLAKNLRFVLVGRFVANGQAGRLSEWITTPEWLLNLILLPLAVWASVKAVRHRDEVVLITGTFVVAMIALLVVTHGDDWTTYRFRTIYWPAYLVIAGVGIEELYARVSPIRYRRLTERLTSDPPTASRIAPVAAGQS
jgi:hypothetical protein